MQRECDALAGLGLARKFEGRWHVQREALLRGKPAGHWLKCGTGVPPVNGLPPGRESWTEKDRQRYFDTQALVTAWKKWQARPLASSHQQLELFAASRASDVGLPIVTLSPSNLVTVRQWAADRGLKLTARALRRYRRLLPVDGNIDRRGQCGTGVSPVDKRLIDHFLDRVLHQNQFSVATAWRDVRDLAAELSITCPSLRWFQVYYKDRVPSYAKSHGRHKPKDFEAAELPKIHRRYDEIAPLEWISLDGHVLNIMCRVPDSRRGWRASRPVLTGVLDIRTRYFVGWDIRGTENSDGILAGLKMMHRQWGCARHYYADNGEAYKASVGARVRRRIFDDPRIGGLCAQTGAERHNAIAYQGWSKMIESIWNHPVREFERYWRSWWGNQPGNRPEQAEKLRVDQLPTVEEVIAGWVEYLRAYHATEQFGDGMNGLTPTLAMEQFRSEVRQLDPQVLDFLCCRILNQPRTVGRDGVTYNNIRYGHFDVEVWKLKSKRVWLRLDPEQAEYVWLCDESGAPLCRASNRTLTGATQEEVREAARIRAQMRRIAREYHQARDFLLDSNIQQIMRTRARHAQAREQKQRARLPEPVTPDVTIVRPDLVAPVKAASQAARPRPVARPASKAVRNGFDLLAEAGQPSAAGPSPEPNFADFYQELPAEEIAENPWDFYAEAAG